MDQSNPGHFRATRISGRDRTCLIIVGAASWLAGGTASFLTDNGAGAATLIGAGAVCSLLALIGRWPSRVSMSGNEVSWEGIKETVDSQIQAATVSGETSEVLAELKSLRMRLDVFQQTGTIPDHPAEQYDKAVESAIARLLPDARTARLNTRRRDQPDFIVHHRGRQMYVETKWQSDPRRAIRGSTLPPLLDNLPDDARLLVIVNTDEPPTVEALKRVSDGVGLRGTIVAWRDVGDDANIAQALRELFRDSP